MSYKSISIFVIAAAFLASCGSEGTKNEGPATDTASTTPASPKELMNAKQILYALPSPVEAAALMKSSGATCDMSLLNPTANVSRYSSNDSKALNLGIYSTDLIFANIFEQTQETTEYFKCANLLATSLGISDAFGASTFKRLKKNMQNKDSLMSIIAEASLSADAYFKENERPVSSAFVAVGGWLEGLYLATAIASNTKDEAIIQRVADLKNSINHLIGLVETFGSEKQLSPILSDLKEIKALFDVLNVKKDENGPKSEKEAGVQTIGVRRKVTITTEQLKALTAKVEQIRNKIVQ
jgi:hypothetical protein